MTQTHPNDCDPTRFLAVASQMAKVYLYVHPESSECGGCRDLDEKLAQADIKTPIVKVPGDTCGALADELGVTQFPTVILMRKGQVVKKHTGISNAKIVEKMMKGR